MNGIRLHYKLIFNNILHHKVYSLFCVVGTALTFVFVTIVAQIADMLLVDTPPVVNAERIVSIPLVMSDDYGNPRKGLTRDDMKIIAANLHNKSYYTCCQSASVDVTVSGRSTDYGVRYVDKDYWKVFQFDFIQGHPFSENEMHMPCVIVNEYFVEKFFPDGDVLNREIEILRRKYKITGVVENVSYFLQEGGASLWIPEQFNQDYVGGYVESYVLFPDRMSDEMSVRQTKDAFGVLAKMFGVKNSKTLNHIETVKEQTKKKYGGSLLLLGVSGILFMLLVVPGLNIVMLNLANASVQANEVGLKRAIGASRWNVFRYMFTENLLLVLIGTILGIALTMPACRLVDMVLFSENIDGGTTILSELKWSVVFIWVLPLSVLFSLLSGGIPIYYLVKRSVNDLLKGGTKC